MVIGVDRVFAAACACQGFIRPPRNNFIGVHVALRAGSCLPDGQRELVCQCAVNNLIGGIDDRITCFCIHGTDSHVCHGGSFLLDTKGADKRGRHFFNADLEILKAALRLGAVIGIGRYGDLPQ